MARTGLQSLIRLHEWTVDEKKRELGVQLRALEELHRRIEHLELEIKRERELAAGDPILSAHFNRYYQHAMERREGLRRQVRAKEKDIEKVREAVNAAYRHLKKYERAQEIRDRRAAAELAKREQDILDEVAGQRVKAPPAP